MSYDRHEYGKLSSRQRAERQIKSAQSFIKTTEQAAVHADHLMGDPHWSVYQQMLQGAVEKTEAAQVALTEKLVDVSVVNQDEIMRLKLIVAEQRGMLLAWQTAIRLPRDLKNDHDKAASMLQELLAKQGVTDGGDAETNAE